MKNRLLNLLWAGPVATFLFAGLCYGQATATITGMVVDPQGARVPKATVIARKIDTRAERTTLTTSDGLFRFDTLEPGVYDIHVDATGFSAAEAKSILLQVGEQRDVNFTLNVSGGTEKVTVTATAPLVETTKTDVSSIIDEKDVATLPTTTAFSVAGTSGVNGISNDYAGLAALAPGVKYDFTGVSADLVGPGSVNARGIQVNLDGGNISDQVVSTRDALGASLEEVKEFQVLTNNYNAEYGQAGGVILNVITKSGSNEFHGDAHAYFRGRNLTANTFLYNETTDDSDFRRAPFQKQEGGLTAGGPIVPDKTFWFVSYEQAHQSLPVTLTFPGQGTTTDQPISELLASAKIDQQLGPNNRLSVRYNLQRDTEANLLVQISPAATPNSLVNETVHDNTFNIALTSTPTSHTVNEARFFWHRFLTELPTNTDVPGIQFPFGYTGAAFCCPQGGLQNRYQWVDNFSWTHGDHTVKTGFNISHFRYFSLFQQFHFGEYSQFGSNGLPTEFTTGFGPGQVNANDNIYGFYVQDTWKITPSLTMNYGLRYDLEVGAFTGGTIPTAGGGCLEGNGLIPACSSDHNNFQPRLGIAWAPRFQTGFLHTLFGDPDQSVIRASFAEVTELAFLNVSLDSLNFDGKTLLTTNISDPSVLKFFPNQPPQSALAPFETTSAGFGRVRPIADNLHNPETRHANLTISRQLGKSLVVEAGYIGVFGFGLFGEQDTNFPPILPDPRHPGFFYEGNRPDSAFTAIRTNENSRTSHYNGFTLHVTKRLSHHFQVQGGYVLSKAIADTEDFFGTSEPGDPNNIKGDMSLAQIDVRNQVNFGLVADTNGITERPVLRNIVNNWTIGLTGQIQSGRPYPISTGDGPFSGSTFPGIGAETQQRPNVLGGGVLSTKNIAGSSGTNLLIGPNGAATCGCPQTTFLAPPGASPLGALDSITGDPVDFQFVDGDLARDMGHTAAYYRFDMSFIKSFRIVPSHEQMRLEFKVDIFNILNQTNFLNFNGADVLNILPLGIDFKTGRGIPNCTLCLNVFNGEYIGRNGQPLTLQDLEHGRVSADLANPVFGGIGDPTSTDLARTIQLSVRFRW
jgi:hypothetical protein